MATGSELVKLLSVMSYGRAKTLKEENLLSLQFLNLANLDLWSCLMENKKQHQVLNFDAADDDDKTYFSYRELENNYFELEIPDNLNSIVAIYDKNKQLLDFADVNQMFSFSSTEYNFIENKLSFKKDANTEKILFVVLPNPPQINNDDTPITHIPEIFQHALVSGAMYYATVSTFGFADKIQIQLTMWESIKEKITYLCNNKVMF